MNYFIVANDKVDGDVTIPASQMLKTELMKSGIDISDWKVESERYYGKHSLFCINVGDIPATYDEEGIPTSFVPGLHINLYAPNEIDAAEWDLAVQIVNPVTPFLGF